MLYLDMMNLEQAKIILKALEPYVGTISKPLNRKIKKFLIVPSNADERNVYVIQWHKCLDNEEKISKILDFFPHCKEFTIFAQHDIPFPDFYGEFINDFLSANNINLLPQD